MDNLFLIITFKRITGDQSIAGTVVFLDTNLKGEHILQHFIIETSSEEPVTQDKISMSPSSKIGK